MTLGQAPVPHEWKRLVDGHFECAVCHKITHHAPHNVPLEERACNPNPVFRFRERQESKSLVSQPERTPLYLMQEITVRLMSIIQRDELSVEHYDRGQSRWVFQREAMEARDLLNELAVALANADKPIPFLPTQTSVIKNPAQWTASPEQYRSVSDYEAVARRAVEEFVDKADMNVTNFDAQVGEVPPHARDMLDRAIAARDALTPKDKPNG